MLYVVRVIVHPRIRRQISKNKLNALFHLYVQRIYKPSLEFLRQIFDVLYLTVHANEANIMVVNFLFFIFPNYCFLKY